jgi:hypothetical protein
MSATTFGRDQEERQSAYAHDSSLTRPRGRQAVVSCTSPRISRSSCPLRALWRLTACAATLAAVEPRLTPNALVLSHNAHATDALMRWAEQSGRRFSFFREQLTGHWYPASGIGAAWRICCFGVDITSAAVP